MAELSSGSRPISEAGLGALTDRLCAIVGPAHVLTGTGVQDYARDATFMRSEPALVVRPESTSEVAAVVAACRAFGRRLVARGSGTSLVGGSVPLDEAVVLSLERIRNLEVDPANAVAVVGSGVITAEVDRAAAAHGLMYPPDPASVEMCSIGGNVACNSGGMRCLKYGVTADYVIGLTVVLADASVLRLGGRVRKRSSGYRLIQLFVGSEGTLGIVTEVILKLIPRPPQQAAALVGFRTLEDASMAVSRLMGEGLLPSALELLDGNCLGLVRQYLPADFDPAMGAALIVEQDGADSDAVEAALMRMVEVMDGADNRVAQSSTERERLWRARREVPRILSSRPQGRFPEDVAVPLARIPDMVRRCEEISRSTGLAIYVYGHAGDGNLHPSVMFSADQKHLVGQAATAIFRAAVELGGTISAEHGLGALKRDHAALEHGPEAISLMRGIKHLLDPEGMLNPHKLLPEAEVGPGFLERLPGWERSSGL